MCASPSPPPPNGSSKQWHQRRKTKRCRASVVVAQDSPNFKPFVTEQQQPAFPYFLHNPRVRRKRQRLPSSLVIENADFGNAIVFGSEAFPMNANDYTSTENPVLTRR